MDILVLTGSPKGEVSVTLQYVTYLRKTRPAHRFEVLEVAREVGRLERTPSAWEALEGALRRADLVLWAFPVYVLLVPSQYKRFLELLLERGAGSLLAGKYAAALSTSIRYFDHTAHQYVHAVSDDLGLKYLGFHSAGMLDLLEAEGRGRLDRFADFVESAVARAVPVQRTHPPLRWPELTYVPQTPPRVSPLGGRRAVIVTDDDGRSPNLAAMTDRLARAFSGAVEVVNLHQVDIRGGCLGCLHCGYDNVCAYTDGFADFFQTKLASADIVVLAGAVRDRALSSKWKQFFDRTFYKGHVPSFGGKQVALLVAGPLAQLPHLRQALAAWADTYEYHAHFLTDEVATSGELDSLVDALAERLVRSAETGYVPARTFLGVGGRKLLRDSLYGPLRVPFRADIRYYHAHGGFDFPQGDYRTRLANALLLPLTWLAPARRWLYTHANQKLVEPFGQVLRAVPVASAGALAPAPSASSPPPEDAPRPANGA